MQDRERRDYILITVALLVCMFLMYLWTEGGWVLAVTMIISAVVSLGSYWLGRRYKKRKQ